MFTSWISLIRMNCDRYYKIGWGWRRRVDGARARGEVAQNVMSLKSSRSSCDFFLSCRGPVACWFLLKSATSKVDQSCQQFTQLFAQAFQTFWARPRNMTLSGGDKVVHSWRCVDIYFFPKACGPYIDFAVPRRKREIYDRSLELSPCFRCSAATLSERFSSRQRVSRDHF